MPDAPLQGHQIQMLQGARQQAAVPSAAPPGSDGTARRQTALEQELRREVAALRCAREAESLERARLEEQLTTSEASCRALRDRLEGDCRKLSAVANGLRSELEALRRPAVAGAEEDSGAFAASCASLLHELVPATCGSPSPRTMRSVEDRLLRQVYQRILSTGLTQRHALLLLGLPDAAGLLGKPQRDDVPWGTCAVGSPQRPASAAPAGQGVAGRRALEAQAAHMRSQLYPWPLAPADAAKEPRPTTGPHLEAGLPYSAARGRMAAPHSRSQPNLRGHQQQRPWVWKCDEGGR